VIERAVQDCLGLLDHSLLTITSLQEDPTLQQVETEARELEQVYDNVRGTVQTIATTQQFAKMREAQVLKAQVDAARQKEAVLKEHI